MSDDLRYPIGPFSLEGEITAERRQGFIDDIAHITGLRERMGW
jgi:hypothetical protein